MTGAQAGLLAWMDETRLTGQVRTDRSSNVGNLRRLARRDPGYTFGVDLDPSWDEDALLRLMVERVGISPDPAFARGQDTIDGRLTVERLTAFGRRLRAALDEDALILFATGHPAALSFVHAELAAAVRRAGGRVLELDTVLPVDELPLRVDGPEGGEIRQLSSVCMRYRDGNLLHTHEPTFAVALLDALEARGVRPGLVVADHGWAGAAGARGIPTIGFADCNDPALFVAEAQGSVDVTVPIDDGLLGHVYVPVVRHLLASAGLDRTGSPSTEGASS